MTWVDQSVLGGFKSVGSFITRSRQAKADKAWQRYNNALARMQNANNQNNITINQGLAAERLTRERFAVQTSSYQTQASAEVAAGAIGAEGNSVDLVMLDIRRNAERAQQQLTRGFEETILMTQEQRRASNLQTEMQIDYTQIPKPNIAQDLMQWGADSVGKWWESKVK